MKKNVIHREGRLTFEMGVIIAAVALCIGTYFIAGLFDAPPLKTFADAAVTQP